MLQHIVELTASAYRYLKSLV